MRPTATVVLVVPASDRWPRAQACLETLRPTLGIRDRVVVVLVDDDAVETSRAWRRYGWVTVVTLAAGSTASAAVAAGAAAATGDVVVLLQHDAVVPSRWLDGLLSPFADATVAGTGPCSNTGSPPQLVPDAPGSGVRTTDVQRFARTWRDAHRGETTQVQRLDGSCLAVRRGSVDLTALPDVGDGVAAAVESLSLLLTTAGHRLLVAHESFVHVDPSSTGSSVAVPTAEVVVPGPRRPARSGRRATLSACLIVKDEEDNLPSCLAALDGLVDEIVVYDTGSSDSTVLLARASGAHVIEGYWDDDFARARNAALDACSSEWILHVDADEIVDVDGRRLRKELQSAEGADALTVAIGNVDADGRVGVWHNAIRLFRRQRARWTGRLHEQIVAVDGGALEGWASSLRLRHTGYTDEAVASKDKLERNLRVARLSLTEQGEDDPFALINLARSLTGVGRHHEAVELFSRALELTEHRALRRQALRFGIEALLNLGRPAEALEWLPRLRQVCAEPVMPDYFEGLARLNLRDAAGAAACFERIGSPDLLKDEDVALPGHFVATRKGLALIMGGRYREAADALLTAVDGSQTSHALWAPLLEAFAQGGLSLDELVAVDTDPRCLNLLGHAANASPSAGLALAEHLWAQPAHRPGVVALLHRLATRLQLDDVLQWAVRLRREGHVEHCPLRVFAGCADQPPLERLKAVAVLAESLDDPSVARLLPAVAAATPEDQTSQALLVLDGLAPALLPPFLLALVAEPERVASTARALDELGAHEQADSLRQHCLV